MKTDLGPRVTVGGAPRPDPPLHIPGEGVPGVDRRDPDGVVTEEAPDSLLSVDGAGNPVDESGMGVDDEAVGKKGVHQRLDARPKGLGGIEACIEEILERPRFPLVPVLRVFRRPDPVEGGAIHRDKLAFLDR
jgi:hypothetical protein